MTKSSQDGTTKPHPPGSAASQSQRTLPPPRPISISMSGCGFLCSYHIGVIMCFRKHSKILFSNVSAFCGASAGALVASLCVLTPNSLEAALEQVYQLSTEVRRKFAGALNPNFNMAKRLTEIVDGFLPLDVSPANNRLFISVTRQKDNTNRLISTYPNRDYLIQCLNATCYLPVYSSNLAPVIDGEKYKDGVYSNNMPILEGMRTITVSPFSGSAKISPRDRNFLGSELQMNLGDHFLNVNIPNIVRGTQALFPPSSDILAQYYQLGYTDAMHYLLKKDLYEREDGTEV